MNIESTNQEHTMKRSQYRKLLEVAKYAIDRAPTPNTPDGYIDVTDFFDYDLDRKRWARNDAPELVAEWDATARRWAEPHPA